MILDNIEIGRDAPREINALIEIPTHGAPVKYELEKDSGALVVDRFFGTAMHYPCNYGFVPRTLAEDGDAVDVLVLTPVPLLSGSIILCRPVGVLNMTDESGVDAKVIAVPVDKLTRLYSDVKEPADLPEGLLNEIAHFFEQYKALEIEKWSRIEGWQGAEAARAEIVSSAGRYERVRTP